ncbi:DNA methyltransferase, partial [Pseudomonadales bacterium]|nr:DNA methyltransferase [Pseudomonadales bacterium]
AKIKKYNSELASATHGDLWGERSEKYVALQTLKLAGPMFPKFESPKPLHLFVKRDYSLHEVYNDGFLITEFMPINSVGVVTARDKFTIDRGKETLWQRIRAFVQMDDESARDAFSLGSDVKDWTVVGAREDIGIPDEKFLAKVSYRPFDDRWTYYTGTSRGFLCRPRWEVMRHMFEPGNFALAISRQNKGGHGFKHVFCHHNISESSLVSNKTSEISSTLPLYLAGQDLDQTSRINFAPNLYNRIKDLSIGPGRVAADEVQVFDYIYGVLHCPGYRNNFAEFLAMNYPRIPWPKTSKEFWNISNKGAQLRGLHLMQAESIGHVKKSFSGKGDNFVGKTRFSEGRVWINDQQYFDEVSEVSWTLSIGAYQPAQKWLKDQKGKELSSNDIVHYQKILKVLSETSRIMNSIEMQF